MWESGPLCLSRTAAFFSFFKFKIDCKLTFVFLWSNSSLISVQGQPTHIHLPLEQKLAGGFAWNKGSLVKRREQADTQQKREESGLKRVKLGLHQNLAIKPYPAGLDWIKKNIIVIQLNNMIIYIIRFAMTQLYFAVHVAWWAELIFHCFWECDVLLLRCKPTCHHFWEFSFSGLVLFLGVNIRWHHLTYISSRVCLVKKMQILSSKTSIWNINCNLAKENS